MPWRCQYWSRGSGAMLRLEDCLGLELCSSALFTCIIGKARMSNSKPIQSPTQSSVATKSSKDLKPQTLTEAFNDSLKQRSVSSHRGVGRQC